MAITTTILRPGDVVGGFRVEDVIGIGGMAIVYRAEQIFLGRPVALKVLSSKLANDAVFRERFRREGKHAAALEHPNIVPVYDSGEYEGLLYLAMRLVEGTNLGERLETSGLTADDAIELLTPIASALDTAHAAGLIHRDVKPQNVLLTTQGHPYLADFGVAKGSNTYGLTATGGFVGSVNYASPEQIRGLTLTPASDVYALTAVLYHCLTGAVPYPRETDAGVMHAHLHEPPPTLPKLDGANTDFLTVLERGMAKDPDARYERAGDLLGAAALSVSRLAPAVRKAVPAFPFDAPTEAPVAVPPAVRAHPTETPAAAPVVRGLAAEASAAAPVVRAHSTGAPAAPSADVGVGSRAGDTEIVGPAEMAGRGGGVGSHTTADRRRMPLPEPEPLRAGPRALRPRLLGAGVAAIAAIALGVLLLGRGAGAQTTVLHRGFIELSYTSPWREVASPAQPAGGPRLGSALALTRPGETLTAGALDDTASAPGSLPAGLAVGLGATPHARAVSLRKLTAVAYDLGAHASARARTILVVPTARGDLAVLCAATRGSSDLSACLAVAHTLRVVGVQAVPPGADAHLASQLSQSLAPTVAARAHASGLSSARVGVRAVTAQRLAAADQSTAKALSSLSPQPRDRALVAALERAVGAEASALRALVPAAVRRDRAAYGSAVAALTAAQRRLVEARGALYRAGFTALPTLHALTAPALPSVHRTTTHAPDVSTHASAAGAESPAPSAPAVSPTASSAPEAPAASAPAPAHHTAPSHHSGPVIEEAHPLH
jgi:tRNA A-37 threonylcarbamoyl transferase component Bud32